MTGLWLMMMMMAGAVFTPLHVYQGTWTVTSTHTMAGPGKTDTLVNHCTEGDAFYSCEQVVNGKPMALLVFTATDDPTKFHTQPVLPDGNALGMADLTIDGNHWTFLGKGKDSKGNTVFYRTENYFTGQDKIHSEQFESSDQKTWVKRNEADEVRVK